MRRYLRRAFVWGTLAVLASVVADRARGETIDDLLTRFRTDQTPADFVVLVDTSASMAGPKFEAVRRSLQALLDAASVNDYLAVVGFDRAPHYLLPPHRLGDRRAELQGAIGGLPEPSASPRPGDWGATDLGAGFGKLLDELARPHAGEAKFVFLLTDGIHQPPRGTRYPPGETAPWEELRSRAEQVIDPSVEVTWLWFAEGASSEHVRFVCPNCSPLTLGPAEMASYFERLKDIIRVRKLGCQVASQLARTPVALTTGPAEGRLRYGDQRTVDLTVRSCLSRLDVAVALQPLEPSGGRVALSLQPAGDVVLKSGEERSAGKLVIRHRGDGLVAAALSSLGKRLPPAKQTVSLPAKVTVEPRDSLRRLLPNATLETTVDLSLPVNLQVRPFFKPGATWAALILFAVVSYAVYWLQRHGLRLGRIGCRAQWWALVLGFLLLAGAGCLLLWLLYLFARG
jgi:hypothetical protein